MKTLRQAIDGIGKALGKAAEKLVPSVAGRGLTDPGLLNWVWRHYAVSYERTGIHKDMHRMDEDDPVISFALNMIPSRALGLEDSTLDSLTVTVQGEDFPDELDLEDKPDAGDLKRTVAKAQWEVKQLVKRLKLTRMEAWQIMRRTIKWGNELREVLYEPESMDIVGLKPLPEHTLWPNMDEKGNRLPGYIQRPENTPSGSAEIRFHEYEIVHFTFGEINGFLGTPLLKSTRKDWKRLHLALDMTGLARIIRAFVKFVHKVPISSSDSPEQAQTRVDKYKQNMTTRKIFDQDLTALEQEPWPYTVTTDFFIPDDGTNRGGVGMLDPENAQLQNIQDIQHFMDRIITATHIPKRYFPFEGGTPKLSEGGGQAEDKNFACLLVICQNSLKEGLSQLFDWQLTLKGINPSWVRYVFGMPAINTTDQLRLAQTQLALSRAMDMVLNKYPELRRHVGHMLREYTRMSDAAQQELSRVELDDDKPSGTDEGDGNGTGRTPRVQLPGTGVGEDVRSKV